MAVKYINFWKNFWQFCSNSLGNDCPRVFEVADYESEVTISKLKTADKLTNFVCFKSDCYME